MWRAFYILWQHFRKLIRQTKNKNKFTYFNKVMANMSAPLSSKINLPCM